MFGHLLVFFLLIFMPSVCFGKEEWPLSEKERERVGKLVNTAVKEHRFEDADIIDGCIDNGRYRDFYTIDRRCYVTPEQKQQKPFDTVVALYKTDDVPPCTGTIVKDLKDNNFYVYTAAHCTDYEHDTTVNIRLQNGQTIEDLKAVAFGYGTNYSDVAIYKIPKEYTKDIPFVTVGGMYSGYYDLVGYGLLSIMSDEQIHIAKEAFANALETLNNKIDDEEIWYKILAEILPTDKELKVSFDCHLTTDNKEDSYVKQLIEDPEPETKCQSWGGDSGGPLFNGQGKLVGIHTRGAYDSINLKDKTYANTDLTGQEYALDVQEHFHRPDHRTEIKTHDINGNCWRVIGEDDGEYIDPDLCDDLAKGGWKITIKAQNNNKDVVYTGLAHCKPGTETELLAGCWCKNPDKDKYFVYELTYETRKECSYRCPYYCMRRFADILGF